MREHLIGYLLNAVEPEERAMVEEQLKHDEALRREMELLQQRLASAGLRCQPSCSAAGLGAALLPVCFFSGGS